MGAWSDGCVVRVGRMITTRGELVKALCWTMDNKLYCVFMVGVPRWLWGRSGSGGEMMVSPRGWVLFTSLGGTRGEGRAGRSLPLGGTFGNGTVWRGEITGGLTRVASHCTNGG